MKLYVYVYNAKNNSINSFDIEAEFREKTKFGSGYTVSLKDEENIHNIPFPYDKCFIRKELINEPVLCAFSEYCAFYTKPDMNQFVDSVISKMENDIGEKKNNLKFLLSLNT